MTASAARPEIWASSELYVSGPDAGTPCKIDPASNLNGFIAGTGAAAQAMNFLLNQVTRQARASAEAGALYNWSLLHTADPPPSGTVGIGVVFDTALKRSLIVKGGSDGSHIVRDDTRAALSASSTGTVTAVKDAAFDPAAGRVVIVSTAGGFIARSSDFGSTWSDASSGAVARDHVVWDATNSLFLATNSNSSSLRSSPDGDAWTSRALTGLSSGGGLATNSLGRTLVPRGTGGSIGFDVSTNGTSFSNLGSTPNLTGIDTAAGSIAALGEKFFFCARYSSGAVLKIHMFAPTGFLWSELASITLPEAATSNNVRMLADSYSGALYAVAGPSSRSYIYCSLDGGSTWFGPAAISTEATASIQASGGRLYANQGEILQMTPARLTPAL